MKPPQFAIWMFTEPGARAGDELVDLYPGSGAVAEAWRPYTGRIVASPPAPRHVAAWERAPEPPAYELAVACQ